VLCARAIDRVPVELDPEAGSPRDVGARGLYVALHVDYPLTAVLHDDQAAALDAMLTTLTARARALADSAETPTHV
jgi:hypothetical protein